jgi:amino acid transporter
LPKKFAEVHPKYKTPSFATIITGVAVGLPILFTDKSFILDFTSIGTIFAFVLVNGGILLMPAREKLKGSFHLPYINSKYIFPILFIGGLIGFTFGNLNFFTIYGIFQMKNKANSDFLSSFILLLI